MIEALVCFCESNLLKVKITKECVSVLVASNSYKHMRMLIIAGVSVCETLDDICE